jgi:hypothetical protein
MKISPLSSLRTEDFPKDLQKWLPQLLGPLNGFLTNTTTALQGKLDFQNNTLGQQQIFTFTYASASTTLPLKFLITMQGAPTSLIVSRATENGVPVILNVAWQNLNGFVQISDIAKTVSGVTSTLVVGNKYVLQVRAET